MMMMRGRSFFPLRLSALTPALTPAPTSCGRVFLPHLPSPSSSLAPSLSLPLPRFFATGEERGEKGKGTRLPHFEIIDTTLREGEQFSTSEFTRSDRIYIAKVLSDIGVEYIELVNPAASEQAVQDCKTLSALNLRSKFLTHIRCHMHDAQAAVASGVQGVNVYMATSKILREHSHGKPIDAIVETAAQVIEFVKKHGLEVRFSCEDAFRSDLSDILKVYSEVAKLGVNRVGVADTVGIATPSQVSQVIQAVRGAINNDQIGIEFHTHNDTGCCIANALVALEAGATHIDTTVLGIGERNGITPLGGFFFLLSLLPPPSLYSSQLS